MRKTHFNKMSVAILAGCLLVAGWISAPTAVRSDDRDVFKQTGGSPYVMILFDTTGSMGWNIAGNVPPLRDDDPTVRLQLAKSALDGVMQNVSGVNFGFATFPDQDGHFVNFKRNVAAGTYAVDFGGGGQSTACSGWEPNDDTAQDLFQGYSFRHPTVTNARGLDVGDLIPLDWGDDNVDRIRERLAPNYVNDGFAAVPDYGIEDYFEDADAPGKWYRALKLSNERPIVSQGRTPLAGTLDSFRSWHADWLTTAVDHDPFLNAGCRAVYVILMTDGFESCSGNPNQAAKDLLAAGIPTYVIGFAQNNPTLHTIAVDGGTDSDPDDPTVAAYTAADQAQLASAFNAILSDVLNQARSFATAAVPSVVGSAADNLYLTSFSPVDDPELLWPARIDGWRKPLPLVNVTVPGGGTRKVPNRPLRCTGPTDDSCLAWDAGEEVVPLAPTQAQVDSDNFLIGNATNKRRVYYSKVRQNDELPAQRLFFTPPLVQSDQFELYGPEGFGYALPIVDPDPLVTAANLAAFLGAGKEVIRDSLKQKNAIIDAPPPESGTQAKTYVFADVFHSDPTVLTEPNRFRYFGHDVAGEFFACPDPDDMSKYPCFVQRHLNRRRVLFFGSNEGAVHGIDAGIPEEDPVTHEVTFTSGSGKELFAFMPRTVMQEVRKMSEGAGQLYTVDGPVVLDDFKIDPISSATDPPDNDDREWRTVLLGGLREGGKGYYALDVTQPDKMNSGQTIPTIVDYRPGCIDGGPDCGPVDYASVLWDFSHTWDEDDNGAPDLGDTWSKPATGRIKVMVGSDEEERYVAIFGGGMDPEFKRNPTDDAGNTNPYMGNFLFMVDIETGKVIYKRRLDVLPSTVPTSPVELDAPAGMVVPSSVPSEVAALDGDFDSYIDTLYVGTTGGYMFKVDISTPELLASVDSRDYSEDDPITNVPPLVRTVERVVAPSWEPFPIFNTNCTIADPEGCTRPIYYPPSVIFVQEQARFGLAFGTGDREDIRLNNTSEGRFYTFLDGGMIPGLSGLPFDETKLDVVDPLDASQDPLPTPVKFLLLPDGDGLQGWVMHLLEDERVLNRSVAISGIMSFSTFKPDPVTDAESGVCLATGQSRLYVTKLTSGTPLPNDEDSVIIATVDDFVTQPFIETGAPIEADHGGGPPDTSGRVCGTDEMLAAREQLKDEFPAGCTFSNYSLNMQVMLSETGLQCVVPVPVCIVDANWKEF